MSRGVLCGCGMRRLGSSGLSCSGAALRDFPLGHSAYVVGRIQGSPLCSAQPLQLGGASFPPRRSSAPSTVLPLVTSRHHHLPTGFATMTLDNISDCEISLAPLLLSAQDMAAADGLSSTPTMKRGKRTAWRCPFFTETGQLSSRACETVYWRCGRLS